MSDENGVDTASGIARFSVTDVSMAGLSHTVSSSHNLMGYVNGFYEGWTGDSYDIGLGYKNMINNGGSFDYRKRFTVNIGGSTEEFAVNTNGTLEPTKGGTLVFSGGAASTAFCGGTTGTATYTSGDGTVAVLNLLIRHSSSGGPNETAPGGCASVGTITYPNGTILTFHQETTNAPLGRIRAITRNDGIQLLYRWAADGRLNGVTAINNAYEVCDPFASSCALTMAWPSSNYTRSADFRQLSITDMRGATTRYTMDRFYRVASVKPPSSTVNTITYTYCARPSYQDPYGGGWIYYQTSDGQLCTVQASTIGSGGTPGSIQLTRTYDRTLQVVKNGQTWSYQFPTGTYGNYYYNYSSSGPTGGTYALTTILGTGAMTTFGSSWGKANFENSARNRIINGQGRGTYYQVYTYDARGNVTSDGVLTAGFDVTCTSMFKCNKPNWTKDAAGNQTDFTYSTVHGGVLTSAQPADQDGIRPQIRYSYVQRYAWYKNLGGTMIRSTTPIWKLASESYCRTSSYAGSACAVAGDEVVTTYDYGPDSAPNNLWLRGIAVTADGSTRRTCYGYDRFGNRISETSPKAGLTSCP